MASLYSRKTARQPSSPPPPTTAAHVPTQQAPPAAPTADLCIFCSEEWRSLETYGVKEEAAYRASLAAPAHSTIASTETQAAPTAATAVPALTAADAVQSPVCECAHCF